VDENNVGFLKDFLAVFYVNGKRSLAFDVDFVVRWFGVEGGKLCGFGGGKRKGRIGWGNDRLLLHLWDIY